ncbi:MAG: helicase-related protein, partial [Coriobacteriales bacterium]
RLASALDNRPLRFDEFEQRIPQFIYVSATPGDYEERVSQQVVEQIIRPTGLLDPKIELRPTKGQIDDLIGEVKDVVDAGERVLVTTLTKKMAEELTDHLLDQGVRANYLHSDVGTLERVEILRDLRAGRFDVLVGINLLREGLDLPEVSLVCILDADKEGFLRNKRSLIQTIGRAARNVSGRVLMYADNVTDSMRIALDETARRRAIQEAYNTEHGIEPKTIRKAINSIMDSLEGAQDAGTGEQSAAESLAAEVAELGKEEVMRLLATLEEQMAAASEKLDFEAAARLRDQIVSLRATVERTDEAEALKRLKSTARKGSTHGTRKNMGKRR